MRDQALKIKRNSDLGLIKQYSELMTQVRSKKFDQSDSEVKILLEKAAALKKIMGVLRMDLRYRNLQSLDLTDIALKQVNLKGAWLQGAWLSKNV